VAPACLQLTAAPLHFTTPVIHSLWALALVVGLIASAKAPGNGTRHSFTHGSTQQQHLLQLQPPQKPATATSIAYLTAAPSNGNRWAETEGKAGKKWQRARGHACAYAHAEHALSVYAAANNSACTLTNTHARALALDLLAAEPGGFWP